MCRNTYKMEVVDHIVSSSGMTSLGDNIYNIKWNSQFSFIVIMSNEVSTAKSYFYDKQ
jgi:glutamine cyclotransferase